MRPAATAKATANTSSGTIAPSAAARTALVGTRATTHWLGDAGAADPACEPARSAAEAASSIGRRANTAGIATAASAAVAVSSTRTVTPARHPARPIAGPSSWAVMQTTSLDTTSGRMVMRIALIHSVPATSATVPTGASRGPATPTAMPVASPAASPSRALVPRLIAIAGCPLPIA